MALGDGRGQRPSPPGRLGAQNLPHTKDSELLERNSKRAQYFTSHRLRLHPVAALLTCLLKRHAVQSTISRGYQVEMPIDAALTSYRDPLLAPDQPRRFCNPGSSGSSLFPGSCPGTPEWASRQPVARAGRSARMRLKFGTSERCMGPPGTYGWSIPSDGDTVVAPKSGKTKASARRRCAGKKADEGRGCPGL